MNRPQPIPDASRVSSRKGSGEICLLEQGSAAFYVDVLQRLTQGGIPFLIGGSFAYAQYAGANRPTKDLDIFMKWSDVVNAFALLEVAGYDTALPFPHWLGKVHQHESFIDVIFGSGNGIARVDDLWFDHATEGTALGVPVRLCPPEEMIWSKAFVQERERFDGADVLHLLRALAPSLAWERLLMRFGPHWRVLMSHLILFGFVYPDLQSSVPTWVTGELIRRLEVDEAEPAPHVCRGPLLSRAQYRSDLERLGYRDARLTPEGSMTREQIDEWTAAIDEEQAG